MTALLRLHIKKLLSDERRKLFKTQIILLCSPTFIHHYKVRYHRYIEICEKINWFILLLLQALLLFGQISQENIQTNRWVYIIIAIFYYSYMVLLHKPVRNSLFSNIILR